MKYALVDSGVIQVGPRDYHHGFFAEYVKEAGLESKSVPIQYNGNTTIVISDTISIIPVAEYITPQHNSFVEQLAGPYHEITPDIINGHYDVVDKPIDNVRNDLKALVSSKRYDREVGGVKLIVAGTEVTVDTSREGRNIWFQSSFLLPEDSTQQFKFPEGWVGLTKSDAEMIVAGIRGHVQAAFDWEAELVAKIEVADKTECVAIKDSLEEKNNRPGPV